MKTRMEKYYTEQIPTINSTRANKNKELYKEVNTTELKDFNLNSNVSVLGDNSSNIDLGKVKDLLDEKYQKEPKRELNMKKVEPLPIETMDLDETREYDINAILAQAKETKEVDYEVDRLKKIRNTQYDILNNLDLEKTVQDEEDFTQEQAKLMDLINTITSKEMATEVNRKLKEEVKEEKPKKEEVLESTIATKEFEPLAKTDTIVTKEFKNEDTFDNLLATTTDLNPLDLLTDLKGDNEATTTLGAVQEEIKQKEIKKEEPQKPVSKIEKNMENTKERLFNTMTMENTLSNSSQFSQSDFDDFNDLKDDMKAAKLVIKILIVLVIIAFIVGCIFLANNIFNLGLL